MRVRQGFLRFAGATLMSLVWFCAEASDFPRSEVFPFERLAPELRKEAETLLLNAMDGEALYTIIGGMKPMSSGWFSTRINVEKPDWTEPERVRRILPQFRVGDELGATLQPFWRVFEATRYLEAAVFHRKAFSEAIASYPETFGFHGLSPSSEPAQVLVAIDRDNATRRNRAYGYLFGYPKYAVDFFVKAEDSRRRTRQFVERDFLSIPVFKGATNHFVYAVPKGHVPNEDDLAMRRQAAPILAQYRRLRAEYVGEGKRGIVQLVRDWMDDGRGRCSGATAVRKALEATAREER